MGAGDFLSFEDSSLLRIPTLMPTKPHSQCNWHRGRGRRKRKTQRGGGGGGKKWGMRVRASPGLFREKRRKRRNLGAEGGGGGRGEKKRFILRKNRGAEEEGRRRDLLGSCVCARYYSCFCYANWGSFPPPPLCQRRLPRRRVSVHRHTKERNIAIFPLAPFTSHNSKGGDPENFPHISSSRPRDFSPFFIFFSRHFFLFPALFPLPLFFPLHTEPRPPFPAPSSPSSSTEGGSATSGDFEEEEEEVVEEEEEVGAGFDTLLGLAVKRLRAEKNGGGG